MKKSICSKIVFTIFLILVLSQLISLQVFSETSEDHDYKTIDSTAKNNVNPEGVWEGKLNIGAIKLRIVFRISSEDVLSATVDSPNQNLFDIPVGEVRVSGNNVSLVIPAVNGEWNGVLEDNILKGTWKQAGSNIPLELVLLDKSINDYSRPQDPLEPYPYKVKDITFENPEAGITLSGTLTYPESDTAVPAVILVSGSGPQNRNEEIMGHRPFLVLADHLTKAGIAVLRFDDRGVAESTGDFSTATSKDFMSDTKAAVSYLKKQKNIKISKLGIAGHSEGGLIAPIVATKTPEVDFIILMAGPGFNGQVISEQQNEANMRVMGADEKTISNTLNTNKELYKIAVAVEDKEEAAAQMKAILEPLDKTEQESQIVIEQLLSPWFRYLLIHDPISVLEQLTLPVLAINGGLDLQVLPKENLKSIEEALIRAGNKQYTIKEFEEKNHLFQTATNGLMQEYGTIEETFSPEVLEYISCWINGLK